LQVYSWPFPHPLTRSQRENFARGATISSPEFITSLPTDILPAADMEVALVKCKEKSISEAMKADGARLVETHGAFGFPWMVVHRSGGTVASFFGSDRFSNMAWWYVSLLQTL
jgi:protein-disulfide isomerase-like protein with CxxC motif